MRTNLPQGKLYCTGYWHLPSNKKRNLAHYQRLLPLTLQMLKGARLHLFCDDTRIEDNFRTVARGHDISLTVQNIRLDELPTAAFIGPILETCDRLVAEGGLEKQLNTLEKKDEHLSKDFVYSGRETFGHLLAIWTSKIPLLAHLSRQVGQSTSQIIWTDVSVSRFNAGRTNWDFRRQSWPADKVGHYKSRMLYMNTTLPLNASFLGATPELWKEIEPLFLSELKSRAGDGYIHDEETILSHVIAARPDRFHQIGKPVRGLARLPWKLAYLMKGLE